MTDKYPVGHEPSGDELRRKPCTSLPYPDGIVTKNYERKHSPRRDPTCAVGGDYFRDVLGWGPV